MIKSIVIAASAAALVVGSIAIAQTSGNMSSNTNGDTAASGSLGASGYTSPPSAADQGAASQYSSGSYGAGAPTTGSGAGERG
ncbi:MAG TPA: hypothetical protein VGI79_09715 [Caulobacteraceae bacterium]|jgi:hypothetical protein